MNENEVLIYHLPSNSDKWTQTLYTGEKHQFINPAKQNKVHCYHLANALGNSTKCSL